MTDDPQQPNDHPPTSLNPGEDRWAETPDERASTQYAIARMRGETPSDIPPTTLGGCE